MLEDENRKNEIEAKREEFRKLANELRDIPFEDEDLLRLGEREILNPRECAVVIVDMQGSYCDPAEVLPQLMGSTTDRLSKIASKLEKFLEVAREVGVTVAWTKMKENAEDMPENYKIKWRIDDTPPLSVPGTKGYEYMGISPKTGDLEVEKNTYSSFESTDLDQQLKDRGIKTIIVVGGYTSRCVEATIADAVDRKEGGYLAFTCRDLVGIPDNDVAEELAMLQKVKDIYGFVKTPRVISEAWNSYK